MKFCIIALFLLASQYCRAQNPEFAYRVYFTDKNTTIYSLDTPVQFLSLRALQRREKYNISVDSSDLPVCQNYIDSILSVTNGTLHSVSKWQNTVVVLLTDSTLIHLTENFSFTKSATLVAVYPNGLARPDSIPSPAQPTGFDQNYYGAAWKQISLCNGQELHQHGLTGEGMLIAFIDAGFQGVNNIDAFDSIRQNNQIISRWNFVHNTTEEVNEGTHGTEVLSIVAANLPMTFVGTAPKASVALYTTEDLTSEQPIEQDNWVAAAEKADSLGVDLITTSLGYNTFDPPFPDEVYSDFDGKTTFAAQGANWAASKGILVIASAGNEGVSPWHYLLTPGDADSALTIGAVDDTNSPLANSSYGPNAAGLRKPDVVAMGAGSAAINDQGSINYVSGTSFATPVIAGLAACLLQKDSNTTPFTIKEIVRAAADHFNNPNDHIGYGLPDFGKALDLLTSIKQDKTRTSTSTFSLFPNPVQGHNLYINFLQPSQGEFQIIIQTISGIELFEKSYPQLSGTYLKLSLPEMAAGLYFVTLRSPKAFATQQFLKL